MTTDPQNQSDPSEERRGSPDRVVAFTDGVFAIIVTILVLEVSVPPALSGDELTEALKETAPTITAWVISFLITGMYWSWHRDLFSMVRRVNRDVVWLNLLYLLPTSLIPFGAALLGEYHDESVALIIYGSILIASNLVRIVLYRYVMHRPELLWETPTARGRRIGMFLAAVPIAVYLAAMAVSVVAPLASVLIYLALPLMYFVLITVMRQRPATSSEAADFS